MKTVFLSSCFVHIVLFRQHDGEAGGELTLGGIDSSHYEGDLAYVSLDSSTFWHITVDR